jgi:hypothetical protein
MIFILICFGGDCDQEQAQDCGKIQSCENSTRANFPLSSPRHVHAQGRIARKSAVAAGKN